MILVLLVSSGLLGLLFSSLARSSSDLPPTSAPTFAVMPSPSSAAAAQPDAPTSEVVADVNGRIITREMVQTMARIDLAMADLFGAPPAADLTARSVNGELVIQAAQRAGVEPSPISEQAAAAWLEQVGRTQADLSAALARNGIDIAAFNAYRTRLQFIDQYATQQAARLGVSVDEYVLGLQRQARISFGPAAQAYTGASVAGGPNGGAAGVTPVAPSGDENAAAAAATAPAAVTVDANGAALANGALDPNQTQDTPPLPPEADSAAAAPPLGMGAQAGLLAPPFDLPGLNLPNGKNTLSLESLTGRPAIVNFFATWCPYCRKQTPLLVEAAQKYPTELQFVGLDVGENQAQVLGYIQEMNIPYPVLIDEDSQVAAAYSVSGFPTTLFIDAEGRVVNVQVGLMTAEELDRLISDLLLGSGN